MQTRHKKQMMIAKEFLISGRIGLGMPLKIRNREELDCALAQASG
jgi:hypothetical protein